MSDETASLDTILNQTPEQPDLNPREPEQVDEKPAPDAKADDAAKVEAKPETGVKDNQDGTPPPEGDETKAKPDNDPQEAFKKAAIDERRKRQAYEQRIAALEQQLQQVKGQPKAPDMFEDPEGYSAWQQSQVNSQLTGMKLQLSESMVRDSVGDEAFEDAMEYFREEVQRNPGVINDLNNSPNPAKFAYNVGLDAKKRATIGDPDQFAARIAQETEKRMLASMDQIVADRVQAALAERLPKSLAGVQSSGERGSMQPVDNGPKPLSAILGD